MIEIEPLPFLFDSVLPKIPYTKILSNVPSNISVAASKLNHIILHLPIPMLHIPMSMARSFNPPYVRGCVPLMRSADLMGRHDFGVGYILVFCCADEVLRAYELGVRGGWARIIEMNSDEGIAGLRGHADHGVVYLEALNINVT